MILLENFLKSVNSKDLLKTISNNSSYFKKAVKLDDSKALRLFEEMQKREAEIYTESNDFVIVEQIIIPVESNNTIKAKNVPVNNKTEYLNLSISNQENKLTERFINTTI